jgi:hypothetical protein
MDAVLQTHQKNGAKRLTVYLTQRGRIGRESETDGVTEVLVREPEGAFGPLRNSLHDLEQRVRHSIPQRLPSVLVDGDAVSLPPQERGRIALENLNVDSELQQTVSQAKAAQPGSCNRNLRARDSTHPEAFSLMQAFSRPAKTTGK